jgi:hypothetical protein
VTDGSAPDPRLEELTQRMRAIEASLRRLEGRLSRLEGAEEKSSAETPERPAAEPSEPPADAAAREPGPVLLGIGLVGVLSLVGRSCLVLCGAYLIRAFADAGTLPLAEGVVAGLAYALVWIVFADRAAAKRASLSANFHGLSAAAIAYPLVWEATTKFRVIPVPLSAFAVAAVTLLLLGVAWRREIRAVAWAGALAAIGAALALVATTFAIEAFTAVLILLGAATAWVAYARRWHLIRWPAALAADGAVLLMASLASRAGGPPDAYRAMSIPGARLLAIALPVAYLGSFVLRTLVRKRNVTAFEVLQTVAALGCGFGGAVAIERATGSGAEGLGAAAVLLALACYAVAFAFVDRSLDRRRNFLFYSWLALVLILAGSGLLFASRPLAVAWAMMALSTAILGGRYQRMTLRAHSTVYVAAAVLESGLAAWSLEMYVAAPDRGWRQLNPAAVLVFAAAVVCYGILGLSQGAARRWSSRLPGFALAFVVVFEAGAFAIGAVVRLWTGGVGLPDPASLAAIRSAVLSVAVVLLASSARLSLFPELRSLAYPVLIAGGLKFLFEDLPVGRPATMFVALALYGTALIVAPRLLRRPRELRGPSPGP